MSKRIRTGLSGPRIFWLQAGIVVLALGWLLLAPPERGMMILLPLDSDAARTAPLLALDGGARLVSAGPLPGSMIIYGDRDSLPISFVADHILTLASPAGGCS